MRATIATSLLLILATYQASEAQPRLRGHQARIQRVTPATPPDDGYFTQYLTGPAGRKTPLREYPGSATVITRKMMDDIQANNLCDALRFAPGVVAGGC